MGIGRTFVALWGSRAARRWRALVVGSTALALVAAGGMLEARSAEQLRAVAVSQVDASKVVLESLNQPRPAQKPKQTVPMGALSSEAVHVVPPPPPPPPPARPVLASAKAPAKPAAPAAAPKAVYVAEVLRLVNVERANAGLAPLVANGSLNSSSAAHASWMAANGALQHSSYPGGWSAWGENIAQGYGSAASVVAGWMNSSGHRANILNPAYTDMGLGYVAAGNYWCQQFGG